MVMDAANQRLELFLKNKKNIDFSKEKGVPIGVDAKNESQRLQEPPATHTPSRFLKPRVAHPTLFKVRWATP